MILTKQTNHRTSLSWRAAANTGGVTVMYFHRVPTLPAFPRANGRWRWHPGLGRPLVQIQMAVLGQRCWAASCRCWGKAASTAPGEGTRPLGRGRRAPCCPWWQSRA